MTATAFASLSGSMFNTVVKARHAYVEAARAYDAAADACTCAKRCRCTDAAWYAYQEASAAKAEREAAWAEYIAIRRA